jgi:hypothetical protein
MSHEPAPGVTRLEHATTAGVITLAAGSFVLSYDALHQLAMVNHVPRPLAWSWPLIVDGFIITASLAVLHAVLRRRSTLYPWLLVLGFSTTSIAFNVLHAPATPIARLVGAIPPLTLVLSFELLMRQLRDRLSVPAKTAVVIEPQITEAGPPAEQRETAQVPGSTTTTPSLLHQARKIHDERRRDGTKLTGRVLSQMLGISEGYARRLLREISAADSASHAA